MFREGDIVYKPLYIEVTSTLPSFGRRSFEASFVGRDCDSGEQTNVTGDSLVDKFVSSTDYDETIDVTKTELAAKLTTVGTLPFTVVFDKSDGTERTLTGCLINHEDLLGRSMVRDLRITKGSPLRQVDHRTLKSLIVNNVRYVLKEK